MRALPEVKVAQPGTLRRHLEGWELGLLTVCMALVAAMLAVPRAVTPDVLPVPEVDRRLERQEAVDDRQRVDVAMSQPLPFDVRAVGDLLRSYGRASLEDRPETAGARLQELQAGAAATRARHGDTPLLTLRALQTYLFLRALSRWETTGVAPTDLVELGGGLLQEAHRNGWVVRPHRLVLSGAERRALFRVRWADVMGLRDATALAPTLDDWRAYYRFLLEHPADAASAGPGRGQAVAQLRVVRALESIDHEYPAVLARGVLLFRLGNYFAAAEAFRQHLDQNPRGKWTLRAENYLAAALDRAQESDAL
jgi:hypothetical protein